MKAITAERHECCGDEFTGNILCKTQAEECWCHDTPEVIYEAGARDQLAALEPVLAAAKALRIRDTLTADEWGGTGETFYAVPASDALKLQQALRDAGLGDT